MEHHASVDLFFRFSVVEIIISFNVSAGIGKVHSGSVESNSSGISKIHSGSVKGDSSSSGEVQSGGSVKGKSASSASGGKESGSSSERGGKSSSSFENEGLSGENLGVNDSLDLSVDGDLLDDGGWHRDFSDVDFLLDSRSVVVVRFLVVNEVLHDGLGDDLLGRSLDDLSSGLFLVDGWVNDWLVVLVSVGLSVQLNDGVVSLDGWDDRGSVVDLRLRSVEHFGSVFPS